jgi:hypothetical protein
MLRYAKLSRSRRACPELVEGISALSSAIPNYRIQPALSKRMASQHPSHRHHAAAKRPIPLHCFHRVLRTSRHVPARRRKHRRDPPLISSEQPQRDSFHFSPSFLAIVSRARPTSSSTTENSSVSTDFLGLITTSTAPDLASASRRNRTASRSRRLIRFRSTAPPSTRPTVKPTRATPLDETLASEMPSGEAPSARRK